MSNKPIPFMDLYHIEEDDRIHLMGQHLMNSEPGYFSTTLVDADPGKIDRYIQKLTTWYPLIEVFDRGTGPVDRVLWFKARKKAH